MKDISIPFKMELSSVYIDGQGSRAGEQDVAQFKGLYAMGLNMKVRPEIFP